MNDSINETIIQATEVVVPGLGVVLPFTGHPTLDMFVITLLTTLFTTLIHKFLSDQIAIKALKKEIKELGKKSRKIAVKDPEKARVLQQELMRKTMENFRHMFKPMLFSALPLLIVFFYVQQFYSPFGVLIDLGFIQFPWLMTYIVFSIICSIIIRKAMDVA